VGGGRGGLVKQHGAHVSDNQETKSAAEIGEAANTFILVAGCLGEFKGTGV